MKVLRLVFHVLYYVLFLLVYIAFLCFASLLLDHIDSLGAIMAATMAFFSWPRLWWSPL